MRLLSLAERRRRSSPPAEPPKPPATPEPPKKSWFAWSLFLNTSLLTALASIAIVVYVAVTTYGKFVILPFEITGELDDKGRLGESLAISLSRSIEELSELYSTAHIGKMSPSPLAKTDILTPFLAEIPLNDIPTSAAISQQVVLTHFSVAGVEVPIGAWVFSLLRHFHGQFVKTNLEVWNDSYIVRVEAGGGVKFNIRANKSAGYLWLVDMIAAELSNRYAWLQIPQSRAPSIMYFTRGFSHYTRYKDLADPAELGEARKNYQTALSIDPNFALARLHLAATQYSSRDPKEINEAIKNFEGVSTDDRFGNKAKAGVVASILRYLDWSNDCSSHDRLLEHADTILREYLAGEQQIRAPEDLVLRGEVRYELARRDANSDDCKNSARRKQRGTRDLIARFAASLADFRSAEALLPKQSALDYRRIGTKILEMYALDEIVNLLVDDGNLHESKKTIEEVRNVAATATRDMAPIPKWQLTQAWPKIRLFFADADLKDAHIGSRLGSDITGQLKSAERNLRIALDSGIDETIDSALMKMAELKYSGQDVKETTKFLDEYLRRGDRDPGSMLQPQAYALNVMVLEPAFRCRAEARLTKAISSDDQNVLTRLLMAELLYRSGRYDQAGEQITEAKFGLGSNHLWYGEPLQTGVALTEVKILLARGQREQAVDLLRSWFGGQAAASAEGMRLSPQSKFDLVEIASRVPENTRPPELADLHLEDETAILALVQGVPGKPSPPDCTN